MDEWAPEPQEQGWREPPRRRPPTAVGVATPPPPRGPRNSRYRESRMHRIGRVFAQLAVATACGIAAGEYISLSLLATSLIGLGGARVILPRRRSRVAQRVVGFGSSQSRRAA